MKAEQVDQALSQKFVTEGARRVFWHDPNGEFADNADPRDAVFKALGVQ